MVKPVGNLITIGDARKWGSFLTSYIAVYGSLRTSSLANDKTERARLIQERCLSIGTFILKEWRIYYMGKHKKFPAAYYTGNENDYIVVEILDLNPNIKEDIVKLYELHYILDTYEDLHNLYRPVLIKIELPNEEVAYAKIYECLIESTETNHINNGDFISPKGDSLISYKFLNYAERDTTTSS